MPRIGAGAVLIVIAALTMRAAQRTAPRTPEPRVEHIDSFLIRGPKCFLLRLAA